jgi:hypothetical protein
MVFRVVSVLLVILPLTAAAGERIPAAFRHAIPSLRRVTFPVLLPTMFDGYDLDKDHLYVRVIASPHYYELQVNLAPVCDGANICSAGSIKTYDAAYRRSHEDSVEPVSARKVAVDDLPLIRNHHLILDAPVTLARGLTGLYTEAHSGADDGGNSYLRWNDGGIEYVVSTRISTRLSLTQIAGSAIRSGPLFQKQR